MEERPTRNGADKARGRVLKRHGACEDRRNVAGSVSPRK